ncbi:unnamed protein product [Adineta steineri]|nr:unnamed protein product [Adineta steineri]CAF1593135.1 unnamed protein product [Adineta steineri]CAF1679644.1 unnamed protein product [Adineta steineri]CAF1679705.1 unnamed protein product [Adineta steineri]
MANERVVQSIEGKKLAEDLGLEFFETSAKENINVKAVFERLVDIILEKMSDAPEDPSGNNTGQANAGYGSQPGGYNKGGTTRLTVNDQQAKGNQCQC